MHGSSFEAVMQMQGEGGLSPRSATSDALDGNELLPSIGSKLHSEGRCKPCAFFHAKGCHSGASCLFCHQCPAHERQRRKRFLRRIREDLLSDLVSGYDGRTLRSGNSARMLRRTASLEGMALDNALRRVQSARGGISSMDLDDTPRRMYSAHGDIPASSIAGMALDNGVQRMQSAPLQLSGQMPPMDSTMRPAFAGGSPWGTSSVMAPAAALQQVMFVVPPQCTTPYLVQALPQPLAMCVGPETPVAAAGLMPAIGPWQSLSTCPCKPQLHSSELQHQIQVQFHQPAVAGPPLSSLPEPGMFSMQQQHQLGYAAMHGRLHG